MGKNHTLSTQSNRAKALVTLWMDSGIKTGNCKCTISHDNVRFSVTAFINVCATERG